MGSSARSVRAAAGLAGRPEGVLLRHRLPRKRAGFRVGTRCVRKGRSTRPGPRARAGPDRSRRLAPVALDENARKKYHLLVGRDLAEVGARLGVGEDGALYGYELRVVGVPDRRARSVVAARGLSGETHAASIA